jgi:ABC-type Fe3+-siderophore transport system permease subunit
MKLNSNPASFGQEIRPISEPASVNIATLKRVLSHVTIGLLFLAFAMIAGPLLGTGLNWKLVFADAPWTAQFSSPDSLIFWGTRVPRVLAAALAGGSLALAGLVYQAVLRNPLAEPFLLGISAGAGAGKAFLILAAPAFLAVSPIAAVAFCFACRCRAADPTLVAGRFGCGRLQVARASHCRGGHSGDDHFNPNAKPQCP